MIFVSLGKLKNKVTKEMSAEVDRQVGKMAKVGVKLIGAYWTLGRYDTVFIFEAPDEKVAMKIGLVMADIVRTETLVAVPRAEAIKLVE
jgi:uncharacterized protein with GYD domain